MSKQFSKRKANQPAGGFVAIGRDGVSLTSAESSTRQKPSSVTKRQPHQVHTGILKKVSVHNLIRKTTAPSPSSCLKRYEHDGTKWREFCNDVTIDAKTLFTILKSTVEKQKPNRAAKLICASIRDMLDHCNPPLSEPLISASILTFAKEHASFLMHNEVVSALCSLLSANFPVNNPVYQFAPTFVCKILQDSPDWNRALIDCFIDDSLYARYWIDLPSSATLLLNILTAFNTRIPSASMYTACELKYPEHYQHSSETVRNRFSKITSKFTAFLSHVKEICNRKDECAPKNLLRTMCACSGLAQVRLMGALKMDSWLLNGKLQRYAMELFLWISANINLNESEEDDIDTLSALLKLRSLKSKRINTLFNVAFRVILGNDERILNVVMKIILGNELSTNRFPHNMTMMHSLFTFDSNAASKDLASQLVQILVVKEELVRFVRTFFREFVRFSLRLDFDYPSFAQHLYLAANELHNLEKIPNHFFKSLIEFCIMLPFLAITPTVREAAQLRRFSNSSLTSANSDALSRFHRDLRRFFVISLDFLKSSYELWDDRKLYVFSFYRIFYLAGSDYYIAIDNWPAETEIAQYLRIITDGPSCETIVCALLDASIDPHSPLEGADAIDLVENLTKRAYSCIAASDGVPMLQIREFSTIEKLFVAAAYRLPPGFSLNDVYDDENPTLAVKTLYWKTWLICFLWISISKENLIKEAYAKIPTIKVMVQMVLTWEYKFPPSASVSMELPLEKFNADDKLKLKEERKIISNLESRLAGEEIDELHSQLLSKLCSLDPAGVCRRPPDGFLLELSKLNDEFDLCRRLCECRDPDLLADIVKTQGRTRALPSLMNVIESNTIAISHLPIECICELFLYHFNAETMNKSDIERLNAIRYRLQNSLKGDIATETTVQEAFGCFESYLSSSSASKRDVGAHCLALLLQTDLVVPVFPIDVAASPAPLLHSMSFFDSLKRELCFAIAKICPVETRVDRLSDYVNFLGDHMDSCSQHLAAYYVSVMAESLVDAPTNVKVRSSAVSFYEKYVRMVMHDEGVWPLELSSLLSSELPWLTVSFNDPDNANKESDRIQCRMVSCAVYGMLQLLCCRFDLNSSDARRFLIDLWFPGDGPGPEIFHADGVVRLPSSLKIRMLISTDERIVRVAVRNLDSVEAVKFIQHSGLSFYSCSRLFEILDNISVPLSNEMLLEAKKAAPFIRSYRLRGVKGGNIFMDVLNAEISRLEVIVKMEVDDDGVVCVDPFPCIMDRPSISRKYQLHSHLDNVLQYVETYLESGYIDDTWCDIVQIIATDAVYGCKIVALLINQPSLLTELAVPVLLVIGGISSKFSILSDEVQNLFAHVENAANIPNVVVNTLRNFARKTEHVYSVKRPRKKELNAENILKMLCNSSERSISEQNDLVLDYFGIHPEIIPLCTSNRYAYNLLSLLFSKAISSFESIIASIPSRCSSSSISLILRYLLESHRSTLCAALVLSAVFENLKSADSLSFSYENCGVLIEYMLDETQRNAQCLSKIVNFLECISSWNERITCCIFSRLSKILRSNVDVGRKGCVIAIANSFSSRFPDIEIRNDAIKLRSLRSVVLLDKMATSMISNLFKCVHDCGGQESPTYPPHKVLVFLASLPLVTVRHIPLIATHLKSIEYLSSRRIKLSCYTVMRTTLRILQNVIHNLGDKNSCLEPVFESLITLLLAMNRRSIFDLLHIFANILTEYVDWYTNEGKEFLIANCVNIKNIFKGVESAQGIFTIASEAVSVAS